MTSETRLAVVIFAVLVAAIAVPWLLWQHHEASRPELLEARIVTASDSDPVFREGLRRLAPDEGVEVAVAVKIAVPGEPPWWMAPVAALELEGVDGHVESGAWPEPDRVVRVHWFTIESAFMGGVLEPDNLAKRLAYRPFLAPEMGHSLLAEAPPVAHNDDHMGRLEGRLPLPGGTLRLYARVEVAEKSGDVASTQAVTTPGVDALLSASLTAIARSAPLPPPLRPEAGELLLAPGWEGVDESLDGPIRATAGASFDELVERRLAAASRPFAAVALGLDEGEELDRLGTLSLRGEALVAGRRPLRWDADVAPGDVIIAGERWILLLGDDGNGELDLADSALWCFKRPPLASTLDVAVGDVSDGFEHRRRSP